MYHFSFRDNCWTFVDDPSMFMFSSTNTEEVAAIFKELQSGECMVFVLLSISFLIVK